MTQVKTPRPTKTVELPLTKSEIRHQENLHRRDLKRAREQAKTAARLALRDRIAVINTNARLKIEKIQEKATEERKAAHEEYRKQRQADADST